MTTVDQVDVASLTVTNDGGDFLLGRPDLGAYVAVPEPGAVLIRALQGGASLAEATARAGESAGAEVDGQAFIDGLAEAGMFAPPSVADDAGSGRAVRWIEGVPQAVARPLFGRVAWSVYGAAVVFVVATFTVRPALLPAFSDAWFLHDRVLSTVALLPAALLLAGLHEAWHWLAGRAAGVPATFRVSYRGLYVVFETDLSRLASIERRRRYGPFLAGMAIDAVVLALALALRLLAGALALPATADRFLAAVVLYLTFRIVWQWAGVFLRSDGYAVLANALRCHNLYRVSWLTTKRRLWRLGEDETTELAAASPRDRSVARWFSVVYLVGMAVMLAMAAGYAIPVLAGLASWVVRGIGGHAIDTVAFWDSLALAGYVLAQYALIPLLAWRERRQRRAGTLL